MSMLKYLKCMSDKMCELVDLFTAGNVRRDIEILCDVTDPQNPIPVIVRYEYQTDGSSEVISALNLDGTLYAGAVSALRPCVEEQERYDAEEKDFCVNGVSRVRIRVFDATISTGVHITEVWQDVLGAIVAAPTGADVVELGACSAPQLYPFMYEDCVAGGGTERVFELRDSNLAVVSTVSEVSGEDCESCCEDSSNACLGDPAGPLGCSTEGRLKLDIQPGISDGTLGSMGLTITFPTGSGCGDNGTDVMTINFSGPVVIGPADNLDPVVLNPSQAVNAVGGCFAMSNCGLDDPGTNQVQGITVPAGLGDITVTSFGGGAAIWTITWDDTAGTWTGVDDTSNPIAGSAANK